MTFEDAVKRASLVMTAYGVPENEQIHVVHMLANAAVERLLDEQKAILDRKNAMINRVATSFRGNVN
jgi:hypothetical protein